jgi:hypothetical protein
VSKRGGGGIVGTSVRRGRSVLGMMTASTTPAASRDDLCHHCHAAPPAPDRSKCALCLEMIREKERAQRAYRRQNHLCITCGLPAKLDRTLCAKHLAYYRDRFSWEAEQVRQNLARAEGRCIAHGCTSLPAWPDTDRCEVHLALNRAYQHNHRTRKGK